MRCRTRPDHDSIFGYTYCGVPNPLVPHRHPYPTRFHGRVAGAPQAFLPYVNQPTMRGPYMGAARPMQPWELSGLGDLGGVDWPVLGAVAAGAALGAYVGIGPGSSRGTVIAGAAMGAGAAGLLATTLRVQQKIGGQ